ncbi:MAG: hypothetical protein AAFY56_06040 [Pseudomonadota bacterium]
MFVHRGSKFGDYLRHDVLGDVYDPWWILGLEGDDSLVGAAESANILEGGAGNDYYSIKNFADTVIEEAGGGIETVQYNTEVLDAVPELTVVMEGSSFEILTRGGFPTGFHLMDRDVEVIREAHWQDDPERGLNFIGNDQANVFMGDHDNVRLNLAYGMGGDDHLFLGPGNDQGFGGDGNDRLVGGTGDDELHGEAGVDRLEGEAGDDRLHFGTDDGDWASGGAGDDQFFFEGAGRAVAIGGAGSDRFVFEGAYADLEIQDFTAGEDWLDLTFLGLRAEDLFFMPSLEGEAGARIDFLDAAVGYTGGVIFASFVDLDKLVIGTGSDDADIVVIA